MQHTNRTKPALFLAAISMLMLFTFCKNSGLQGKWYIKTVENLEAQKSVQRKQCEYFNFHPGGALTFNSFEDKEDSAEWRQSGDTLMIRGDSTEPYSFFIIASPNDDSLVLTTIKTPHGSTRISFSSECTPAE